MIEYEHQGKLSVGQFNRYYIKCKVPHDVDTSKLKLSLLISNLEAPYKKFLYIIGPYTLYAQLTPINYEEDITQCRDPNDKYIVQMNANIHPGKVFHNTLSFNENSRVMGDEVDMVFGWKLDILSQALLNVNVNYAVEIKNETGDSLALSVDVEPSAEFWNKDPPSLQEPIHLVIVTHGVYSNIGCDMLYLKEKLEQTQSNTMIRGYHGNVTHTEKGIKWLGIRLANYIDGLLNDPRYSKIDRISFVGHSLGGVTQMFAIYYLLGYSGYKTSEGHKLLKHVRPVNFVTLASPLLGTQSEFANLINFGLEIGSMGTTGKDLSLRNRYFSRFHVERDDNKSFFFSKPLLEIIPSDLKLHFYLKSFKHRVLFANVVNDGIVPLKTSALLYLDYQSLTIVDLLKSMSEKQKPPNEINLSNEIEHINSVDQNNAHTAEKTQGFGQSKFKNSESLNHKSNVGVIPEDVKTKKKSIQQDTENNKSQKNTKESDMRNYDPSLHDTVYRLKTLVDMASEIPKKPIRSYTTGALSKKQKQIQRIQVINKSESSNLDTAEDSVPESPNSNLKDSSTDTDVSSSPPIPKASTGISKAITYTPHQSSAVLSTLNAIISPAPDESFFHTFKPLQQEDIKALLERLKSAASESEEDTAISAEPFDANVLGNNVIVHDKIYTYDELPDPYYNKVSKKHAMAHYYFENSSLSKTFFDDTKDNPFLYKSKKSNVLLRKHVKANQLSEKIARLYHYDKPWRKILVNLKPDAHNNIIVRRQFVNSYGWNVVNYLHRIFDYEGILSDQERSTYAASLKELDKLDTVHYDPSLSPMLREFLHLDSKAHSENENDEEGDSSEDEDVSEVGANPFL